MLQCASFPFLQLSQPSVHILQPRANRLLQCMQLRVDAADDVLDSMRAVPQVLAELVVAGHQGDGAAGEEPAELAGAAAAWTWGLDLVDCCDCWFWRKGWRCWWVDVVFGDYDRG